MNVIIFSYFRQGIFIDMGPFMHQTNCFRELKTTVSGQCGGMSNILSSGSLFQVFAAWLKKPCFDVFI